MLDVTNYGKTARLGASVSATQTTIPLMLGQGGNLAVAAGNHYWITVRGASNGTCERMRVIAQGGDTLVVSGRGGDGTSPTAWSTGACVSVEWNPAQLCEYIRQCGAGTPAPSTVTPGTYCLGKCTCITVNAAGIVTNVEQGATAC